MHNLKFEQTYMSCENTATEHFHHPQKFLMPLSSPSFLCPCLQATTDLFLLVIIIIIFFVIIEWFTFSGILCKLNHMYVCFCVWLFSLTVMILRFRLLHVSLSYSFLLIIIVWTHHILVIYSPVKGQFDYSLSPF